MVTKRMNYVLDVNMNVNVCKLLANPIRLITLREVDDKMFKRTN